MGTLGTQEMIFIFVLALVLFGPKKLPEIGRTVGKALSEFRRASSELKATFDREMNNLEAETSLKDADKHPYDSYNYDYSSYEPTGELPYTSETYDTAAVQPSTTSESATEDARSSVAVLPEGTIAHGASPETPSASHEAATGGAEPGGEQNA
ncbi:MAG: twin-arginine translocase TatA/TatE family subunit [Bryobacteraceae bacterium]|jgi:TatA/E family protein of Tat protein translocase